MMLGLLEEALTGDISEAIFRPFGRVVVLSLLGSTWSASVGGRETPAKGMSIEGSELEEPPVSQLAKPGVEEELVATALELA